MKLLLFISHSSSSSRFDTLSKTGSEHPPPPPPPGQGRVDSEHGPDTPDNKAEEQSLPPPPLVNGRPVLPLPLGPNIPARPRLKELKIRKRFPTDDEEEDDFWSLFFIFKEREGE